MTPDYAPKKTIKTNTRRWSRDLDIALPIRDSDIHGFRKWVNWNGYKEDHYAFDFAAYIDSNGRCVLGLPPEIPVRAIADGTVIKVKGVDVFGHGSYFSQIDMEHGNGMRSTYCHLNPLVMYGKSVKKGDAIATLYKEDGCETGRLVHLHLELNNGSAVWPYFIDPTELFPEINELVATPWESKSFEIPQLNPQPEIHIANFRNLRETFQDKTNRKPF